MNREAWICVLAMLVLSGATIAQTPESRASGVAPATTSGSKASAARVATKPDSGATSAQLDDEVQGSLLDKGMQSVQQGNSSEAVDIADQVIAHYESKYSDAKTRWYVARSTQESLLYLVSATVGAEKGRDQRNATVVTSVAWPDAYYLKAYALVEMGDLDHGKVPLERALALMPRNSQYLSELGNIYQADKNWPKAMQDYTDAEATSEFSYPHVKLRDKTRAKRGIAFVLVELGKLDEAEKQYRECLALDPNDSHSPQELEYIRLLRLEKK